MAPLLLLVLGLLAAAGSAAAPIASRLPFHWRDRSATLPNDPVTAVAVDPDDDQVVYVGIDGFLFRSDDGGDTFTVILSFPRGVGDEGGGRDVGTSSGGGGLGGVGIDAEDRLLDGISLDGGDGDFDQGFADDRGFDAFSDMLDPFDAASFGAGGFDPAALEGEYDPTGGTDGFDPALFDPLDFDPADLDPDFARGGPDFDDLPAGSADPDMDPADAIDITVPAHTEAGVRAIVFVPGSRGSFWVATARGLFYTRNHGAAFERIAIPGGTQANDIRDIGIDPNRPSRLWVGTAVGLLLSTDGGQSFTPAAGRAGATPVTALDVHSLDDGKAITQIVVGTEQGLFRSRTSGQEFFDVMVKGAGPFLVIHSLAWTTNGDLLYVGTGDGLYVSERGTAVVERYDGVPDEPVASISPDPGHKGGVAIGLKRGGVLFSDNSGLTLVPVETLPAQGAFALARERKNPDRLWVASERGVFRLQEGTGVRTSTDALRQLQVRWSQEPSLEVTTRRALQYHRIERDADYGALADRAFYSGMLPRVNLQYDFSAGDINQSRITFVFRDPSVLPPFLDPAFDDLDLFGDGLLVISPTQRARHLLRVQLTWDLDRAIFNRQAVSAARRIPVSAAAQRRIVNRVQSLWVARRRLDAELTLGPKKTGPAALKSRIHAELRLAELEAQLNAMVGEEVFHLDGLTIDASSPLTPLRTRAGRPRASLDTRPRDTAR